jgi:hypothetical protein
MLLISYKYEQLIMVINKENLYVKMPKQKLSSTLLFKMSFACFAANGKSWYNKKSIDANSQKAFKQKLAANDDELVDIWWQDILIKISMVNWILPELYILEHTKQ